MRNILSSVTLVLPLLGCATTTTVEYLEVRAEGAKIVNESPTKCSGPSSTLHFDFDNNVRVTLRGYAIEFVDIKLKDGGTFKFVSSEVKLQFPEATQVSTLGMFNHRRAPTSLLTTSLPYENGNFSAHFKVAPPSKSLSDFSVELPPAIINGKSVSIPKINFVSHSITYSKERCFDFR
jgi:hypothetical protein